MKGVFGILVADIVDIAATGSTTLELLAKQRQKADFTPKSASIKCVMKPDMVENKGFQILDFTTISGSVTCV